ncbi:MAG: trigger factor [Lachnospiraceae bacterium]|nr:trigger factor [Lachnospiraceae bacterium]
MKKKLLTMLLAGCMALSLTACGGEEAENQAEQTEQTEDVAAEEGTEESTEETEADESAIGTSTLTELGEYKGLTYTPMDTTVTDEEVEAEVQYLVANSTTKEAQEVAGEDSVVNIDYVGTKDGVAFDGGTAQGQELDIANSNYIEGFAESIVGMKVGETKDCPMTFPENYGVEELNGADVVFTITVNEIWKNVPAELNDEFAVSNGYENVDAIYTAMRESMEYTKQQNANSDTEYQLLEQIIATSTFDINQEEVDLYADQLIEYYEGIAYNYYGVDLETYVTNAMGMTLDDYKAQCEESGLFRVQETLVKRAIADAEGLEITDEEYEAGADTYATYYGYSTTEEFITAVGEEELIDQLRMDKATAVIVDNAVAEEAE